MIERLLNATITVGSLLLLITEILFVVAPYVVACYLELQVDPAVFLFYDGGLAAVAVPTITILISLHAIDPHYLASGSKLVNLICLVLGIAFLTEGVVSFLTRGSLRLPVHAMLVGTLLAGVTLFLERLILGPILSSTAVTPASHSRNTSH